MSDTQDTGHLPECYYSTAAKFPLCICDRLRACEQRVREEAERSANGYGRHCYLLALDRARDAVERLHKPWARAYMDTDVLAAIDALVGEHG